MLVIHAAFPIDPDATDEAVELAEELVEKSNQEEGTIEYRATTDITDENVIRFFEHYEDGEAFQSHTESDHFQQFEEWLPDLLAGEPDIIQFTVTDATELDLD